MREKRVYKEGDLNRAYPHPRVSGYKRRSDITEGDIMEVRVCDNPDYMTHFISTKLSGVNPP
jgi:hypothetical protein